MTVHATLRVFVILAGLGVSAGAEATRGASVPTLLKKVAARLKERGVADESVPLLNKAARGWYRTPDKRPTGNTPHGGAITVDGRAGSLSLQVRVNRAGMRIDGAFYDKGGKKLGPLDIRLPNMSYRAPKNYRPRRRN